MPAFLKSVLSILIGLVLAVTLTLATDALCHLALPARFDADGHTADAFVWSLALVYTLIYVAAGCSCAAFLAPKAPVWHALVLGAVAFALTLLVALRSWNEIPAWYHFALLGLLLPAAYLGGLLGTRSRTDGAEDGDYIPVEERGS